MPGVGKVMRHMGDVRRTRGLVTLAAVVFAALALAGCRGEAKPARVKLIVSDRLDSGSIFTVSYEPRDPADISRLRPHVNLTLKHKGKALNTLLLVSEGLSDFPAENSPPEVLPPDSAVPTVGLRGTGPFKALLPKLAPGRYELCAGVNFADANERVSETVVVCKSVEVVRSAPTP